MLDASSKEFLISFQLHVNQHGIPARCYSDLGSQIVGATKIITSMLEYPEVTEFLKQYNINNVVFETYPKGTHQLGSIVESIIKMAKRLLYGAIGKKLSFL